MPSDSDPASNLIGFRAKEADKTFPQVDFASLHGAVIFPQGFQVLALVLVMRTSESNQRSETLYE